MKNGLATTSKREIIAQTLVGIEYLLECKSQGEFIFPATWQQIDADLESAYLGC